MLSKLFITGSSSDSDILTTILKCTALTLNLHFFPKRRRKHQVVLCTAIVAHEELCKLKKKKKESSQHHLEAIDFVFNFEQYYVFVESLIVESIFY